MALAQPFDGPAPASLLTIGSRDEAVRLDVGGLTLSVAWSALPLVGLLLVLGAFCGPILGLSPVAGALVGAGVVASLLAHELGHAFAARRLGLPVGELRVFLLGAGLRIGAPPSTARATALLSSAGPAVNLALAAVFAAGSGLPGALGGIMLGLAAVNAAIAALNLVPLYPADGGKLLAAAFRGLGAPPARAIRLTQMVTIPLAAALALGGASLLWNASPVSALLFASQWIFLLVHSASSLLGPR